MLPGLGFQEILLIGVIALLVVGPKDLPVMLRELGKWSRKLQAMASEFRSGFDELARQAELDDLRKEVEAMRNSAMIPDLETALTGSEATGIAAAAYPESTPATTTVYGPTGEAYEHTNAQAEPQPALESEPAAEDQSVAVAMPAPKVEAR